jgi:tetratricopeptide (TPR) repeat protein
VVICLKPDYIKAYNNRGLSYYGLGQYQLAIDDFSKAIGMKQDYADAYNNRATVYLKQGNNEIGCGDAQKACALGNCKTLEEAKAKGICF